MSIAASGVQSDKEAPIRPENCPRFTEIFEMRDELPWYVHILFVDPLARFNQISEELLGILKERFPQGLDTSRSGSASTQIPDDPSQIEYAVLKDPTDLERGWRPLNVNEHDTPTTKGLKDNIFVAFAIREEDGAALKDKDFEVHFPSFEDDGEEE